MLKAYLAGMLLSGLCSSVWAAGALTELSSQELSEVRGQAGGADLSLTLSINHLVPNNTSTVPFEYGCANATSQEYCRFAINFANRQDSSGNLYWLVFKKIQGTIQVDQIGIEGSTVTIGTNSYRSSLLVSLYETAPIKIRNFGFESLAIETDSGTADSQKGYLKKTVYGPGAGFDQGLERGFVGLNMHGNLGVGGSIKMFSCNPSGSSRC